METKKKETPIFLFGSGRSGTTLVHRLLNSVDGVYLWGEQGRFIKHMAEAYISTVRGNYGWHTDDKVYCFIKFKAVRCSFFWVTILCHFILILLIVAYVLAVSRPLLAPVEISDYFHRLHQRLFES